MASIVAGVIMSMSIKGIAWGGSSVERFAAGYRRKRYARRSDFSVKVAAKEPSWRVRAGSLAGSSYE